MSRSDAVRQQSLERDGFRCVLCGFDGRDEAQRGGLQVHHIDPLGMGGSDELDTLENAITLCLDCHAEIHAASKKIVRWGISSASQERRFAVQGAGELEVVDIENRKIPHERLWFYRRKKAEELEPIEARIQGLHMIDGKVAEDVWRLWSDDAWKCLDTDSRSWKEYCAARGWDTAKATRLAKRWGDGRMLGLDWGPGETEAEYAKRLKVAGGDKEDRTFLYFRTDIETLRKLLRDGKARFVRCTDDYAATEISVGIKAGKLFGLHSKDGCVTDMDGGVIPVEVAHDASSASCEIY